MAISIEENIALLKSIRDKVAMLAQPMAMAMGEVHERDMKGFLARDGSHGPATPPPRSRLTR